MNRPLIKTVDKIIEEVNPASTPTAITPGKSLVKPAMCSPKDAQKKRKIDEPAQLPNTKVTPGVMTKKPTARTMETLKPKDGSTRSGEEAEMKTRTETTAQEMLGKLNLRRKKRGQWSWLMRAVAKVVVTPSQKMLRQKFRFENTEEAAKHNADQLKRSKWDFVKAMENEEGTMLQVGSEFRHTQVLEPLWGKHKHWQKIKEFIDNGITYPLEPISTETQKEDLKHMVERGNHKSATTPKLNEETLLKNYDNEVAHGWMLPIPKDKVQKLDGAAVIPVGVALQHTIDAEGNRITKRRTTHDATFSPPSTLSVNNRMLRDLLSECFYGHCLIRCLHMIHIMRVNHPLVCIYLIKVDLDAAYRRLHVAARMALLTITVIKT